MVSSSFYPSTIEDYKVHFDQGVAIEGLKLYNFLIRKNAFFKEYLREYVNLDINNTSGKVSLKDKNLVIPESLQDSFYNNVVKKINSSWGVASCRLEKLYPSVHLQGIYERKLRFNELRSDDRPTMEDMKFRHPSTSWHFDSKSRLDNMATILYLSDVSDNGGGTTIADPIIRAIPKDDNTDRVGISQNIIDVKEIKSKTVTGQLGTAVTFSSYSLHRGGIPLDKPRKALIINFIPVENKIL